MSQTLQIVAAKDLGGETRAGDLSKWPVPEKSGERTHLACCFRHPAGNVSQRLSAQCAAKHSSNMKALKTLGRKADAVGLPT
jgi:hypothetical protein